MINFKHIVGGWIHETSKGDEGDADTYFECEALLLCFEEQGLR